MTNHGENPSEGDLQDTQQLRRGWIVGVTGLGLAITAGGCLTSALDPRFGDWRSLVASAIIGVGSSVFLAAFLIWIERNLLQQVRDVAEQTSHRVAEDNRIEMTRSVEHLSSRVDEIADRLSDRLSQQSDVREAMLAAVGQNPSFESVSSALREAKNLNAIVGGAITVPAGDTFDAPRVTVELVQLQTFDQPPQTEMIVRVRCEEISGDAAESVATVNWHQNTTTDEMLGELVDELQRRGLATAASQLKVDTLFANLSAALTQAVQARTGADSWYQKRMLEWLTADCVITEDGLESRTDHLALPLRAVGPAVLLRRRNVDPEATEQPHERYPTPEAPRGVAPELWEVAIKRTVHHADVLRMARVVGPDYF